jgi:seryl-tRNA synthetase
MLQVQQIREHKEDFIARLDKRCIDATAMLDEVIAIDDNRKQTQQQLDEVLAESNGLAKSIGQLFKEGKRDEAEQMKAKTAELKVKSGELKETLGQLENDLTEKLYHIPNVPNPSVPKGKSEEDNEIIRTVGEAVDHSETAKPHWEVAKDFDLIDFERGVKITGAGFPVYKGKGAKLQRALINFFLDQATEAGYDEVIPPLMINEESGYGTGQLPDKEGQMYHVTEDDLYLIPTAEVPITNLYRGEIIETSNLPVKNVGYTPCFRREAGSYGKDVRGLNRLHQFDKVEIVQVVNPEESYKILDQMVDHVTGLLEKLELPYRVLRLCGGDLGFTAALTFDMEVYSGAQKRWLEVSSVSNFETYQANRLKLRHRSGKDKPQLAHTLNGSALALPRIMAALIENNQKDGKVIIPKALVPYTRFETIG